MDKEPKQNKGQGWEEIRYGTAYYFNYVFKCKDCGGTLPEGFIVAPRFCCFCGKDHEG